MRPSQVIRNRYIIYCKIVTNIASHLWTIKRGIRSSLCTYQTPGQLKNMSPNAENSCFFNSGIIEYIYIIPVVLEFSCSTLWQLMLEGIPEFSETVSSIGVVRRSAIYWCDISPTISQHKSQFYLFDTRLAINISTCSGRITTLD